MSWFDAAGFANIAKTALREAQKTIDKALDIKEEDENAVPVNTPVDTNSDDFFGTWGITQSGNIKDRKENAEKLAKLQTSLWGSFTGSFFETDIKSPSYDNLDDSADVNFSQSKLVVQESDDGGHSADTDDTMVEVQLDSPSEASIRKQEKNSSESVELITCSIEEGTTSPDSELSTSSSAKATRQTSESVEVLVDSLTSPSSAEIMGLSDDRSHSEFVSPLGSPLEEEEANPVAAEKGTPDSVEVIPEDQEEDTMSYTSLSESTSATVLDQGFIHLKPQKMLKDTFNTPEVDPITRAPSRSGMHLPLPSTNQILIDTQPQGTRQDVSNILKSTNVIDIPQEDLGESLVESNDDGSQSDRTLIAGGMDSSSDTSITDTGMNNSYLKNLIADAMTEKNSEVPTEKNETEKTKGGLENVSLSQLDMPPREHSPVSSESRSDLVKIGSDHTSGHTSGDELETTTSSDIEIISSPNGDSSSTQSRHSPAKHVIKSKPEDTKELLCKMTMKKAKGHTRELSEASSISDDSHSIELERLVRRISEMTEILESRESKLIDINRRNAELQEINNDLRRQADSILTKQLESVDLSQVTEEYTQRLSALEKKFQQAIREKDGLRKQLEQSKQEAATRMSKSELEPLISEKDETIRELREEGEKLSKQQLQHSNIIKKLRSKEKENENTIKNLKESVEDLSSETERLKKSLAAKGEVERSQIEAVHQLTAKNKKLDGEVNKLKSQLDDLTQKHETAKKSLDAAKKELVDKNRTSTELVAREHKLESLENEKRQTESQNVAIMNELEDLRAKVRELNLDSVKKEEGLRKENKELLRRLEDAEARNEELNQSILEVSKPLVRQLESLQATHSMKVNSFEKIEQELTLKISELQARFQASATSERASRDELVMLRSKQSDLESELNSLKHQNQMIQMQFEQQKTEKQFLEQSLKSEIEDLKEELKSEKQRSQEITSLNKNLEQQFEKNKEVVLEQTPDRSLPQSRSNSPTLSLGKASVASMGSSFWSQDEPFEVGHAPRYSNMFEMQMLQTNLKQREGEVQQLQWELNRREQERSLLNQEISNLLTRVDELENKLQEHEKLKSQLEETQQQYDTLCQLFGEKVEENEELKLDLLDVKDMYKSQIDELLKQQKQN